MLLSPMMFQAAPAAGGDAAAAGGGMTALLMNLLPMVGIIAIFYFLLIRPQSQRAKKHREMLAALKKGDTVVTQGGIIGKVAKISDDEVTIDNGEGVKLRLLRGMIMDVRSRGEPAPANDVKES
jgi:preprotein translocase subunit YajC